MILDYVSISISLVQEKDIAKRRAELRKDAKSNVRKLFITIVIPSPSLLKPPSSSCLHLTSSDIVGKKKTMMRMKLKAT